MLKSYQKSKILRNPTIKIMSDSVNELELLYKKKHDNKFVKKLNSLVSLKDKTILKYLMQLIETEKENGFLINEITKAYFRLSRKGTTDCTPLFVIGDFIGFSEDDNVYTIHESLLEVLGYDKMIPIKKIQQEIIAKYFSFGDGLDYSRYSDPRYGLAAACAGWNKEIVSDFLNNCLTKEDAPLKYVAKKSLESKYIKLR